MNKEIFKYKNFSLKILLLYYKKRERKRAS